MENNLPSIEDLLSKETILDDQTSQGKLSKGIGDIKLKELESSTASQAAQAGFSYINLSGFPISPESLSLIEEKEAVLLGAFCFYRDQENVRMAALDPKDERVSQKLKEIKEKYFFTSADIYQISQVSFDYGLKMYKTLPKVTEPRWGIEITEADLLKFKNELDNLEIFRAKINKANVSEVMTMIIAAAMRLGSSDIHVEAAEEDIVIRFRVDGVLQIAANIDIKRWREVVSRLKVISKVKINISDKPQDGRFTIFLSESNIDVRVSFLPTSKGESVVMRLLMANVEGLNIESLGMQPQAEKILLAEIEKPNGMILTTGPTGSGKTTTLYGILNRLNRPGTKIITLEDPVEYHLKGINQSQIDESKGYTFAKGLRSILRQDPDIVMVGEIRDLETAEISIQSSLTGHLVLSTLHTNDAAGVIPRLLDLGIKPFLLTPSLNAVIGQRLVRKLCPACKIEHVLTETETERIKKILSVMSPKAGINISPKLPTIYKSGENKECSFCQGLGYKGRVGIYEIFTMNNDIKELTAENAPAFKILEKAIDSGMITMLQDGVLKAMDGITSLDEVYQSVGKMDYVDALYDSFMSKTIGRGLKISAEQVKFAEESAANLTQVEETIKNIKSTEMLQAIIAIAVKAEAGDVHVDPTDQGVRIRLRIDGILHDIASLSAEYNIPILAEIKNLIGYEMNDRQPTYEGRFAIYLPGMDRMDARVSIITGGYGETAVIRILSQQASALEIETLGMRGNTLSVVLNAIKKTKGIIINTGPTGSGKTTTLYSLLNRLNQPDIKVITIEDPIEYNLAGVMQTQIDEKGGYTFSNAMRSLMRQNPNIIMIGEIRDAETAKTAIEAALSGHLVLSTVHANSAAGAINRLAELGVERSFLSGSMECSIGQRLVRRICQYCAEPYEPDATLLAQAATIIKNINPKSGITIPQNYSFKRGKGCEHCSGIGYKGRVGLYEAISVTPEIQKLIMSEKITDAEIEAKAIEEGFINMTLDGVLKAIEGLTTLEEVFRVIG